MKVKAAPGTQCPKEGGGKDRITDRKAVEVPDNTFYRRRIAEGSLVEVNVSAPAAKKEDK